MASDDIHKADPAPKTDVPKTDGAETVARAVAAMQAVAKSAKADEGPSDPVGPGAGGTEKVTEKETVAPAAAAKPAAAKSADIKAAASRPAAATVTAAAVAPRRSGAGAFGGLVLGGALCLAAGFGAAVFLPRVAPQFDPLGLAQMRATLTAQADQIAALKAAPAAPAEAGLEPRLAAVEAAQKDLAALTGRLDRVEGQLRDLPQGGSVPAGIGDQIASLRARVEALQAVTGDGGQQATQAMIQSAEQALAGQAQAARDQMGALVSQTDAALRRTLAEAAVARLAAAVDSGLPYALVLAQLGVEAPKVLADAAARGLPTLSTLRAAFPEAARLGLEAALVADLGNSWTDRAANFLRAQTGARSLVPREGTDPDAILSRAEAALAAGDARAALTEVEALPAPAQQAMSAWIDLARQRLAAEAAVADLAQKIGAE